MLERDKRRTDTGCQRASGQCGASLFVRADVNPFHAVCDMLSLKHEQAIFVYEKTGSITAYFLNYFLCIKELFL